MKALQVSIQSFVDFLMIVRRCMLKAEVGYYRVLFCKQLGFPCETWLESVTL